MGVTRQAPSPGGRASSWLPRLAWASLAVNVAIVVTGGVVRLTGSGLGCPTWPRCTEESFRPHGEMDIHTAIEFGNRMVTFLIAAVAIATVVAAYRSGGGRPQRLAVVLLLGVPAQAVIGGITVLTDLNPWTVAFHLLVSMAMIAVAVALVRETRPGWPRPGALKAGPVGSAVRRLATAVFLSGWVVLYLGTVVTGSGPYAGDVDSPRNGLDPESMSQLHTDAVFLLVGLTLALTVLLRAVAPASEASRAAVTLLVVEGAQGGVGFVQYFTGLPVALVSLHLLGAAVTSAAMTWVLLSGRAAVSSTHPAAPPTPPTQPPAQPSSGSSATATKSSVR